MIYDSESLLASWFHMSMLLTTGSLLFYHMTRIKQPSLPVTPWVSALVASGLILCGVIFCLSALVPYNIRSQHELKSNPEETKLHEQNYVIMYNVVGGILVFLQLIICIYIIKDSWQRVS